MRQLHIFKSTTKTGTNQFFL